MRITLFGSSDGALNSWHNAAANCASATTITVAGPTDTESLLARSAAVVTGSVTRAGGALLKGGSVAFYENCQAYLWGQSAGYGYIDENGQYRAAVAPGKTYIVRISPEGGDAALASWHNGVTACDQATSIAVPGDGSHNLVAAPGFVITGTVTSSSGTVEDGYVSFYTTRREDVGIDTMSPESNAVPACGDIPRSDPAGHQRPCRAVLAQRQGRMRDRRPRHRRRQRPDRSCGQWRRTCDRARVQRQRAGRVRHGRFLPHVRGLHGRGTNCGDVLQQRRVRADHPERHLPTFDNGPKQAPIKLDLTLKDRVDPMWWAARERSPGSKFRAAKKKGKCKISASAPGTPGLKAFSKRYTIRVR